VVASSASVAALDASPGKELIPAADGVEFSRTISALLGDAELARAMGRAGRQRVLKSYAWQAQLARIDVHLHACDLEGARV
jgi:glycosyltransferase involved in cell wall biosynthesis